MFGQGVVEELVGVGRLDPAPSHSHFLPVFSGFC